MKTLRLPAILVLALLTAFASACATVEDDATQSSETDELGARPKVELWTTSGKYYFHIAAANGETLVSSQSYTTRTAALNGMLSVLSNGSQDAQYQVRTSTSGGVYFVVLAANRAVIATSEVYASDANAKSGIASTKNAIDAIYERWDTQTGARFDVFQGADGRFYFDLHARNGSIVLQSQGYSTEAAALNGALSVQDNGTSATRYQILQAQDGRWYFNITATNGQVVATGQMYSTKYGAQRGRDAMIALLPQIELL